MGGTPYINQVENAPDFHLSVPSVIMGMYLCQFGA